MIATIWCIVEDETDFHVVKAVLEARKVPVRLRHLRVKGGRAGISRLASQLDTLIDEAIAKKGSSDCIAVIIDRDKHNPAGRDEASHHNIRALCERRKQDVRLIYAQDEIEAWLLADSGVADWLGIKAANADEMARPSERLRTLARSSHRNSYQGADRAKVLREISGDNAGGSPSLQKALKQLEDAPCTRRSE